MEEGARCKDQGTRYEEGRCRGLEEQGSRCKVQRGKGIATDSHALHVSLSYRPELS